MTTAMMKGVKYSHKDYIGKWEIIGEDHGYYMLEHCTYGDETCYLVISKKARVFEGNELRARVFETYDDIETCLIDEGIIL